MTCQIAGVHTYAATGNYLVRITVTDTLGQSRTVLASLSVVGEVIYVSSSGSDVSGCGSSGAPCRQIQYGLGQAEANAKTVVKATGGTYARFDVRSGISVEAGYSADYQTQGATSTVTASPVSGLYSAIMADNVNTATTVSGMTATGPTLGAGSSSTAQAVVVRNGSSNLTLSGLTVNGGQGPSASGLVVYGGSSVTVANSSIASGTTLGNGNSAYGVRAYGGSTVVMTGGTVTAANGVASPNSTGAKPATPPKACDGGYGANATGPSSPGNGGYACGSGNARSGAGGRGGQYSGGGQSGGSGAGSYGGGGNGGCGSLFGCGTDAGNGDSGGGGGGGNAGGPGIHNPVGPSDLWQLRAGGTGNVGDLGSGGGGGGGGKSAVGVRWWWRRWRRWRRSWPRWHHAGSVRWGIVRDLRQ